MRADIKWQTVIVRRLSDLTPRIREIVLSPAGIAAAYPTGAHMAVRVLVGGKQDTRRYSLVGVSPVDGCWRIAVQRAEPGRGGSAYMWSLREGARLEIALMDSHFQLSFGAASYLLVAGGIGITPIMGMASALLQRGAAFSMLYAGRSRRDMGYLDALEAELGDRMRVFADDEGSRMDLSAAFAALPADGEAYVCGPLGLLEAAKRAWMVAGRPPAKLVFETFGSSGAFAAEAFVVKLPRLGLTVDVPAGSTMLDALDQAGVGVLYNCRRGECGLCAMDILAVDGAIDHRDVFFSPQEHAESHQICACVSRIAGGSISVDAAYRGDRPLTPGQGKV